MHNCINCMRTITMKTILWGAALVGTFVAGPAGAGPLANIQFTAYADSIVNHIFDPCQRFLPGESNYDPQCGMTDYRLIADLDTGLLKSISMDINSIDHSSLRENFITHQWLDQRFDEFRLRSSFSDYQSERDWILADSNSGDHTFGSRGRASYSEEASISWSESRFIIDYRFTLLDGYGITGTLDLFGLEWTAITPQVLFIAIY